MRLEKRLHQERFEKTWWRLSIQGLLLMIIGLVLALSSVLNSEAVVMAARDFSWLPLSGMVICILGIQECVEAYLAGSPREFHQNLHVGILDTVVGGLIVLSVSQEPQQLSMMIAAFLLVRGSVRIVLAHVLKLPQKLLTSVTGSISILLGGMLAAHLFPGNAAFLALSLNLEIAFRGWSMMMFSWWIRRRNIEQTQNAG